MTDVPEGLNDRSLAIHCQEQPQSATVPSGYGMMGLYDVV
jgi:hypothetical protein